MNWQEVVADQSSAPCLAMTALHCALSKEDTCIQDQKIR